MTGRNDTWGPRFEPDGSTTFRLWAPAQDRLSLEFRGRQLPMERAEDGWFSVRVEGRTAGAWYMFALADQTLVPDPASRFQPRGAHGPSEVCAPPDFTWQATEWKGRPWEEAVIYEIHVGAFTPEGTYAAVIDHLRHLATIGFTAIEIMPLAQFPGRWGWGYDGVFQYAPHNRYGTPDDFRRLIDAAHQCGLMVFLDVVYNHFGPEGNAMPLYAPDFFRSEDPTPWGARIAFEKEPVRRFFIDNVLYWLDEFHLDGLRLDAVDQISDAGDSHILQEISQAVHARFQDRHVHLVTENPANGTDLLADARNGRRLYVADWNDDFHHAMHVAVTGEWRGYYEPFRHAPWTHLKKALAEGYLREGKKTLKTETPPSASLPPNAFVHFLQNHDQVGNRARGDRLFTAIDMPVYRMLTEILLLSPQTPLFFMGDDHLSSQPFRFFADYTGDLARAIHRGRMNEADNFGGLPKGFRPDDMPDPNARSTFEASKLDWALADTVESLNWQSFLRALINIRREHVVPLLPNAGGYAGRVVTPEDEFIDIDWTLGSALLSLRANASGTARTIGHVAGDLIYATDPGTPREQLQPWSTKVFLKA